MKPLFFTKFGTNKLSVMKQLLYIFTLALSQIAFSQIEKPIHGKVLNEEFPVQGIKVINLVTEKSVITNNNGDFTILVKPNDVIVFYGLGYNYYRKLIDEKDVYNDNLIIRIEKKTVELKEVVIQKSNIDAMSTGVLQKPAKEYTPAERKLRTATTGILDPLVNLISGRTKKLKNQVSIEKQEMLLVKIANLYDDDYYTNKLKIPADYIKAFQYYIVSDDKFAAAMKAKNKSLASFRVVELANDFNRLLQSSNEVK
jgi:hypothetical protein